ncbi:hypothetical protein GGX14DRAFT_620918 [Mycena pura]|uniref:Uncharacterized protein n=1 Tax=Mycena pura TaxID=153505 RepID=A0AAD6VKE8_9AGAR|nr:hypothetical protein GGX14DRAFT_620918 [Mycena pura]
MKFLAADLSKDKPNFDSVFSVVIQKSLSTVFPILGTNQGLGAHVLLASITSDLLEGAADSVNVNGNLEDAFVRTAAAAPAGQGFPRQHFSCIETIKIIPGLRSWISSLYETSSSSDNLKSVIVRKVRRFEEINGGTATNVSEVMNGQCPFLLQ